MSNFDDGLSAILKHRPVYEWAREDGSVPTLQPRRAVLQRKKDGLRENALTPDEAVKLSRQIRSQALTSPLPDSTPFIRADRDTR